MELARKRTGESGDVDATPASGTTHQFQGVFLFVACGDHNLAVVIECYRAWCRGQI